MTEVFHPLKDQQEYTNNSEISANKTLSTLADEIHSQGGPGYSFVNINPVNDHDGGQPGGNIRVAYLYDASVIQLHNPNAGSNTDANDVLPDGELKYNPGLIDPENEAWEASRKPLVTAWETLDGKNKFVTINVHLTSKGGSSSLVGDARPPINGGVEKRTKQAKIIAVSSPLAPFYLSIKPRNTNSNQNFTTTLLSTAPNSKIITPGDFNEFAFVEPLTIFASESGLVDLDDVVDVPANERYSYVFEQNCQQLDHMYVSKALSEKASALKMEHIHVNTWVSYNDQASDHDPTVALMDICD